MLAIGKPEYGRGVGGGEFAETAVALAKVPHRDGAVEAGETGGQQHVPVRVEGEQVPGALAQGADLLSLDVVHHHGGGNG